MISGLLLSCGRTPERQARRGLAALDAGRPDEAVQFLERALHDRADDPETASLWGALGMAATRAGRIEVAESAFQTASSLNDEDFWIHVNYGTFLMKREQFSDALDPLSVAVRADLYRTEALELMAESAMRLGDETLARSLMEEAALRANEPRVLTSLAVLAPTAVESRRLLEEALDLDPAYGPAALNLAILIDRGGQEMLRALHYYERFLSVTPRDEVHPDVRDRVTVLMSRRDGTGGEDETALVQVREMIERSRSAARDGNAVLALNFATRAAQLAQRHGRADLEERALRQGVAAAPGQARAHAALGQFYLTAGRNAEALTSLREAVRLAPDAFPAQVGLARAAAAAHQPSLAREALARAEALASSAAELDSVAAIFRDDLRDRRATRRVEQLRAERFPE